VTPAPEQSPKRSSFCKGFDVVPGLHEDRQPSLICRLLGTSALGQRQMCSAAKLLRATHHETLADMSDDTEFVIVPQGYPIWAIKMLRDGGKVPEPVIAWRIAVNGTARPPIPISPMRGELNPDDIGDYVTTPKVAKRFEETILDVAADEAHGPIGPDNDEDYG
jgi:hypothetical protein